MNPLGALGAAPLSNLLSYTFMTCAGVSVTWFNLSRVFERRASLPFWAYFVLKGFVDAYTWYCISQGYHADFFYGFNNVWSHAMAVVSLFVVLFTFKGDYVQVGVCAAVSDLEAGLLVALTHTFGNLFTGNPVNTGFLEPFSPRTLVCALMMLVGAHLLREPLTWINRFLCRVVLRRRLLWGGAVVCFIAFYANSVNAVVNADLMVPSSFAYNLPFMLLALFVIALLLLRHRRDVKEREKVLASCVALTRSYDLMMYEQLEALERDRVALEGHERTLRELGEGAGDKAIAARVADLERSYLRLSAGSFCDQPALDAVLTSCAARLRGHGVKASFTVAGVRARETVPVAMVLTLLNLALEAAERAPRAGDSEVELRIRSVGEQLFLRLDVPAAWGPLGVRRFLAPYTRDGASIAREHRWQDRRLVMVMTEAQVI